MTQRNKDSKPAPNREELEVGLARYQTPQASYVPRWFVEYGGWLFAGALLIAVLVTVYVIQRRGADGLTVTQSASLVIVGTPRKIWEEGSVTTVKSVQVRVGNQGQAAARQVQVVVVAGARRIQLQGPGEIDRGKSELFSGDIQIKLRQGEDLAIATTCSNCPSGGES